MIEELLRLGKLHCLSQSIPNKGDLVISFLGVFEAN